MRHMAESSCFQPFSFEMGQKNNCRASLKEVKGSISKKLLFIVKFAATSMHERGYS